MQHSQMIILKTQQVYSIPAFRYWIMSLFSLSWPIYTGQLANSGHTAEQCFWGKWFQVTHVRKHTEYTERRISARHSELHLHRFVLIPRFLELPQKIILILVSVNILKSPIIIKWQLDTSSPDKSKKMSKSVKQKAGNVLKCHNVIA